MNWAMIKEKVIVRLTVIGVVCVITFLGGLFVKNYYWIDPFGSWFSFKVPEYQTIHDTWLVTYPNGEFPDEVIEVKQRGPKVWGEGMDLKWMAKYQFSGQITHSNYISYHVRSSEPSSRYIGVGLIKISVEGDTGEGYVVHLGEAGDAPMTTRVKLEAKEKRGKAP